MAKERKQKLKVFRTPIGFHDAFVAAPSRKAALEAWGSATDLFSAEIAEEVKALDGKGAKGALARPGEVIRVERGGGEGGRASPQPDADRRKKKSPKPSRAPLAKAEAALVEL